MDMNPQRVRTAQFSTVRKGLDPAEVQSFLQSVADELERAQNQATAMEARARAAVARLQELPKDAGTPAGAASAASAPEAAPESATAGTAVVAASVDQSETISRTLLLAQHTADAAVAEARAEAERLRTEAEAEANRQLESSREVSETLVNEARAEARQVGEQERTAVEAEVNSMLARRDFLESDVDHLEQFLVDQRSRLRAAATQIINLAERVPDGLGEVRRPLMSGPGEESAEADPAPEADPASEVDPVLEVDPVPEGGSAPEPDQGELRLPNIARGVPPIVNPPADR